MTITNPTRVVTATGNGATTVFPYTFLIPEASDLVVMLYDTITSIATTLDPSQYSATGLGDEAGGSVTYPLTGTPLSSTEKISILRIMPYEQGLDVDGENAYNPALLENQLDKIVMQIQQVAEEVGRAVTVPVGLGVSSEDYFQTLATFAATQINLIDTAGSDAVTAIAADKAAADADAAAAHTSELNAAGSAASAAASALSVAPLPDQINAATDTAFVDADMLTARKASDGSLIKRSWANLKTALASMFLPLAGGALTGDLSLGSHDLAGVATLNGGPLGDFRNKIINGGFDIWQRGTVFNALTANIYNYTADRWIAYLATGDTCSVSRVAFITANNDAGYILGSRWTTTGTGAKQFGQRIEGVKQFANRIVTLSYDVYNQGAAPITLAPAAVQGFGTGGSPSVNVTKNFPAKIVPVGTWTHYSEKVTLDPINGKILGTNGDDQLQVYLHIGTAALDVTFANVSLVYGDATTEANPFSPRHIAQELALCQRYYEKSFDPTIAPAQNLNSILGAISFIAQVTNQSFDSVVAFKVQKRAVPTLTAYSTNAASSNWSTNGDTPISSVASSTLGVNGVAIRASSPLTAGHAYQIHWTAEAEL